MIAFLKNAIPARVRALSIEMRSCLGLGLLSLSLSALALAFGDAAFSSQLLGLGFVYFGAFALLGLISLWLPAKRPAKSGPAA